MRICTLCGIFSVLLSNSPYFHSSSATMKEVFSSAILVLAISRWAAFAVGEFRVLTLPTFSAVYSRSWKS